MYPTVPDRASNAGPESQEPPKDWMDWLFDAEDACRDARNAETQPYNSPRDRAWGNRARIRAIERAVAALQEARELLCR